MDFFFNKSNFKKKNCLVMVSFLSNRTVTKTTSKIILVKLPRFTDMWQSSTQASSSSSLWDTGTDAIQGPLGQGTRAVTQRLSPCIGQYEAC